MALTGEKKREWRRLNRERNRAYMLAWMAKNPDYAERQRVKAREKSRERSRIKAAIDCGPPMPRWCLRCDAGFINRPRKSGYCSNACSRRAATDRQFGPSPYHGEWNWKFAERIALSINQIERRLHASPWVRVAENVARGSRDRAMRPPSDRRRLPPLDGGWVNTTTVAAARLSTASLQLQPQADRQWKRKAHRIAGGMKTRRLDVDGKRSQVKPNDIMRILKEQDYTCAYTGDPLSPENTSADHEVPLSKGGSHSAENIRMVTRTVNAAKGTMTYEEFVAMCRKVVEFHDKRKTEDASANV